MPRRVTPYRGPPSASGQSARSFARSDGAVASPKWRMRRNAVELHDRAINHEIAAELGVRRRFELRQSNAEIVPLAAGMWHPLVLLPASASEWSPERWRIVLLHELAHIQRRDSLTQALAELALCLYWFHPLV